MEHPYNHVQISKKKKSEMSYCINFMPGSGTKKFKKTNFAFLTPTGPLSLFPDPALFNAESQSVNPTLSQNPKSRSFPWDGHKAHCKIGTVASWRR